MPIAPRRPRRTVRPGSHRRKHDGSARGGGRRRDALIGVTRSGDVTRRRNAIQLLGNEVESRTGRTSTYPLLTSRLHPRRVHYLDALDALRLEPTDTVHLYLGVPLCEERCTFCMYYYSRTDDEGARAASTVRDLEKMIERAFADPMTPDIDAMYIGGGTPSVLTVDEIERLLGAVNRHVRFEAGAQLTFEMSPRSATPEKITAVAAHGINRVSMGVRSFDEQVIRRAGRRPTSPQHLARCLDAAAQAGISDVNIDLLLGLDGDSETSVVASVEQLVGMGTPEISVYRYRPARADELADRGGLEAYVTRCAAQAAPAVALAERHGYHCSGRADGEHFKLSLEPKAADARHAYLTRFDPDLANSLVGLGSASRTSLRDERFVYCRHDPSFRVPPNDRVADRGRHGRRSSRSAEELDYLTERDVIDVTDGMIAVRPDRLEEWVYFDKVSYPTEWLARRERETTVRIR